MAEWGMGMGKKAAITMRGNLCQFNILHCIILASVTPAPPKLKGALAYA
jgi:hypothetical protein